MSLNGFPYEHFFSSKIKTQKWQKQKKTLLHKIHICIRLSLAKEINLNRIDE